MRKFITVFGVVGVFVFFSFYIVNRKIAKQFEEFHETEMKTAVNEFYDYVDTHITFFKIGSKGNVVLEKGFYNTIKKIFDIHAEHHNSEKIPRGSKDWNLWTHHYNSNAPVELIVDNDGYAVKRVVKNSKKNTTVCPYCLAERAGKIKEDFVIEDYIKTSLFEYKLDKVINGLLITMGNEEIKNTISEIRKYLNTGKAFSESKQSNSFNSVKLDNDEYFANSTDEYKRLRGKIWAIHNAFHSFSSFGGVVNKTLFHYFYDAKGKYLSASKPITCCPICIVVHEAVEDGKYTRDSDGYSWDDSDEYIWKNNNFAIEALNEYALSKSKQKKELAERRRIREMPLHYLVNIQDEVDNNKITARKKYDRKRLKIGGCIAFVSDDHAVLEADEYGLIGANVFLPKSDLEKLRATQYIEMLATIKFIDTSNSDDVEKGLLNAVENLNYGGTGYMLTDCQLIK